MKRFTLEGSRVSTGRTQALGAIPGAATVALLGIVTVGCTVVPLATAAPSDGSRIEAYIRSIWDGQLVPTVVEQAVDVATLVGAIDEDPDRAGETYGSRPGGGDYSYLVKGEGSVKAVDRSGLVLDVGLPAEAPEIVVATGPVIVSTAVRDAAPFLDFADFATQLEYAEVATAINAKVKDAVVAPLELGQLDGHIGEVVSFAGAFTYSAADKILIVPVHLEVSD